MIIQGVVEHRGVREEGLSLFQKKRVPEKKDYLFLKNRFFRGEGGVELTLCFGESAENK